MRKIILYIAASIDGYIATPGGSVSWLEDPAFHIEGEDFGYADLMNRIDITLMGNSTYKFVESYEGPFPYPDTKNYVFSRSRKGRNEQVTFINDDPAEFVSRLKEEEGKDIWLIGGAQINSLLLARDLIDEIILTTIPVVLGEGIPLFPGIKESPKKFKLMSCKAYDNSFTISIYQEL